MNPITGVFQVICLHLRSPCFKVDLKTRSPNFEIKWILCYSKYFILYPQPLQFVHWTHGWSTIYETKKNPLINTICFRVRLIKGYMEITEWKHTVKSAVHDTWKWYENYSIGLLMPKYTCLWDSTTRLHWYITVLLTFYIVKKQQIFSSLSFYKHYILPAHYTQWCDKVFPKLECIRFSYCHQFCCSVVFCLTFSKKNRVSLVLFQIKMVTTRLKKPWTSFSEI